MVKTCFSIFRPVHSATIITGLKSDCLPVPADFVALLQSKSQFYIPINEFIKKEKVNFARLIHKLCG